MLQEVKDKILANGYATNACVDGIHDIGTASSPQELIQSLIVHIEFAIDKYILHGIYEEYRDLFNEQNFFYNDDCHDGFGIYDKYQVSLNNVTGESKVHVIDDATINAHDNSKVFADGESIIHAFDASRIIAYNSVTVNAHNKSTIMAYDHVTVNAYDKSNIRASGLSIVNAFNHSNINGIGRSKIRRKTRTSNISCKEFSKIE